MTSTTTAKSPSPGSDGNQEVKYLDTVEAYDQWAMVYDTDNNFLQALDTLEMRSFLPQFLSLLPTPTPSTPSNTPPPPKLIDLGCGTGRNTISLLHAAPPTATIIGLEPSTKMLELARGRVQKYFVENPSVPKQTQTTGSGSGGEGQDRVRLQIYNMLDPANPAADGDADGVISTLVLEHVSIDNFFATAAGMLKPGGILLVTNMHSEMGGISQAGFTDPATGVKIRPTSYAHSVAETVAGAERAGFEVLGDVKEVRVDEGLAGVLGPRAGKWVGVVVWFGGCFRKR
ncbi:hypothetical protein FQN50_005170 [Emmonsiellopsis sp. PD_5]|nr:hypothetical protein FQN50_005170 [Emmonsiellopsis sp. PD_5]